ncbi:MAG: G5 domain-containing protein [Defluviitaleaceae bacterium]|nr:G5 domain-containing protein [Defluviitaleaceae bacterium]
MAQEMRKSFASMPKPIDLDAPYKPNTPYMPDESIKRRVVPDFDAPASDERYETRRIPRENDDARYETRRIPRDEGRREESRYETRRLPPPPGAKKRRRPPQEQSARPRRQKSILQGHNVLQRLSGLTSGLVNFKINPMIMSIVGWSVAGIALIGFAIWFITGLLVDNAYAVLVDGQHFGYIRKVPDLTSEGFHEEAVLHLQAARGNVRVQVNQRVTIESARAPARSLESRGDVIGRIHREAFTFTLAAHEIWVNGNYEAILRTQSDLNHVTFMLQEHWWNDNTVEAEFVTNWEVRTVYVCPETTEFDTPDSAYFRLDRRTWQTYAYIVARGDTLDAIAIRFGTDISRIMERNGLTSTTIFPGDTLLIYREMPLLAVRTFDETHWDIPIEPPAERIHNADLPHAATNVIQQGQPGMARVVERVTSINGVEQSREVLDPEVIIEPIPDITEVGTGAATIERR